MASIRQIARAVELVSSGGALVQTFGKVLLDGILGAINTCMEDVAEMGCPYPLHSASFEVARLVIGYDIERFGMDSCVTECALLDDIERLRNK